MKFVSYRTKNSPWRIGVLTEDGVIPSDILTLNEMLQAPDAALEYLERQSRNARPLHDAHLGAPTRQPSKMLFCGTNYEDHLAEIPQISRPEEPFFFSKLPSSITGPRDDIVIPHEGMSIDYEAELAVVIGTRAKSVKPRDVAKHIFGYTAVNDVTARNVQFKDSQITLGKGVDLFCPIGPCVTLASTLDASALSISCTVNGQIRQLGNTSDFIAGVAELVSYLSNTITLEPGDIIATGTPAGVGYAMNPPRFLEPGDEVVVTVEGIGSLNNRFVAGWESR